MSASRAASPIAAVLTALALPLAGCVTPFGSDDPASTAKDPGRQLTLEEVEDALPQVPVGAEVARLDPQPTDLRTDPTECLEVLRSGESATELRSAEVATARRGWAASAPAGSEVTVSVTSYSRPVGGAVLDQAGSAMSSCSDFDYTGQSDGHPFELHLRSQPRTVDPIGEQTFAARITAVEMIGGQERKVFIDQLVVRSGHNLLRLSHSHWDESATHAVLETNARTMLTSLEH